MKVITFYKLFCSFKGRHKNCTNLTVFSHRLPWDGFFLEQFRWMPKFLAIKHKEKIDFERVAVNIEYHGDQR